MDNQNLINDLLSLISVKSNISEQSSEEAARLEKLGDVSGALVNNTGAGTIATYNKELLTIIKRYM